MSKQKQTTRGELKMYLECLLRITTFSGMTGKGIDAYCENINRLQAVVDPILAKEKKLIETLQTPELKKAAAKLQELSGLQEPTQEQLNEKIEAERIISEAENEYNRFRSESDNMTLPMPELVRLSKEDFYTLIEKNSVGPNDLNADGTPKNGLFPAGVQILKKIMYDA